MVDALITDNEQDKLVFSASSLKTYDTCGRKFYLSKIEKAEPTHKDSYIFSWIGKIVHTSTYYSVADYKKGSWEVTDIKSINRVRNFFETLWAGEVTVVTKALDEYGDFTFGRPDFKAFEVNEKKYAGQGEEGWKQLAWDLVQNGYQIVTSLFELDNFQQLQIEVPINFEHLGAEFVGFIDLLVEANDRLIFFDLKTSKKPITVPDKDLQFHLYKVGLKKVYGLNYYPIGYYVHLRSGRLYSALEQDDALIQEMDNKAKELIDGIYSNKFLPAYGSPLCRYCEYRGYCYTSDSLIGGSWKELLPKYSAPKYEEEPALIGLGDEIE